MRPAVLFAGAAVALLLNAQAATAQQDGAEPPRRASVALEAAARYARALPVRPDTVVLAAQGTQEGHWRFVNRAGEMFTVGTPDEMQRVVSVLYPEAKPGARVALYMTEDTVFRHGVAFKSLPASAELNMVLGSESYRLLRRTDQAAQQLFAEVRANLALELGDRQLLEEALWHLSRPLAKGGARFLALEPGGPPTLAASPRIDAGTRRALVDAVDPASLAHAMGDVPGQMLVLLGRAERNLLHVKPRSAPEQSLALANLFKAADAADVSLLVLLAASTPRQPAGSGSLWQGAVRRPGEAAPEATLADLLNALAGSSRRLAVAATRAGGRTVLEATLVGDLSGASAPRPADARLPALSSDISAAGVYAVRAYVLSAARQSDLDQRIIAGVPMVVQAAYGALVLLGLLGAPVARAWWRRVWPPEAASEYAGRAGYWAACSVRFLTFALIFLPLTAAVAAPYSLGSQIWEAAREPGNWWRRISGRGDGRQSAPPPVPDRPGGERATASRPKAAPPANVSHRPPPPPVQPLQEAPRRKPARSWIAALPTEEETK